MRASARNVARDSLGLERSPSSLACLVLVAASCVPSQARIEPPEHVVLGAILRLESGEVLWLDGRADEKLEWPAALLAEQDAQLVALAREDVRSIHPAVDFERLRDARFEWAEASPTCSRGVIDSDWSTIRRRLPETAVRNPPTGGPDLEVVLPISELVCGGPIFGRRFQPGLPNRSVIEGEIRDHHNEATHPDFEFFNFVSVLRMGSERRVVSVGTRLYQLARGQPLLASQTVDSAGTYLRNMPAIVRTSSHSALVAMELGTGEDRAVTESELWSLEVSSDGLAFSGPVLGSLESGVGARTYRAIAAGQDGSIVAVGDRGIVRTATRARGPFHSIRVDDSDFGVAAPTGRPDWPFVIAGDDGRVFLVSASGSARQLTFPGGNEVTAAVGLDDVLVLGDLLGRIWLMSYSDERWTQLDLSLVPGLCGVRDECGHFRATNEILALAAESQGIVATVEHCPPMFFDWAACSRAVWPSEDPRDAAFVAHDVVIDGREGSISGPFGLLYDFDSP